MQFVVKDEILNAVLGYLATRPFQEVAALIKAIHEDAKPYGEANHEEKTVSGNDQEG